MPTPLNHEFQGRIENVRMLFDGSTLIDVTQENTDNTATIHVPRHWVMQYHLSPGDSVIVTLTLPGHA